MDTPRYRPVRVGACLAAEVQQRADGSVLLQAIEPLAPFPARLSDRLQLWANRHPERTLAAQRSAEGGWRQLSYADMLGRARSLGQALVDLGLNAERPVLILSDNDLEHLSLMLAALWVGVPTVSVSPAYSLISTDHARLRHIAQASTPGLVFASDERFAAAINAVLPADVPALLTRGSVPGRASLSMASLLATVPDGGESQAHLASGPDSIAKLMFTSGSTRQPKGVVVTQRMWCANQQQIQQAMSFLADTPPVIVDWLPWNHTFGGNHNLGLVLYNGGTHYIDEGKPTPQGMAATLRNLAEISPTVYFNVPKGFDELVGAMDRDAALRDRFFARLQAFECGGAGLSASTLEAFHRHAEASVGERIKLIAGLGMTETAPSCTLSMRDPARAGCIGLPLPGVEVKLVPVDGKLEVRFRGPNVMPGYWREPELTRAAFDEEGFYCTGDAARFVDEQDPQQGLMFDGRIAEDFKLSTGTFVSVGPLRAKVVAQGFPFVQDAVVTGINRDEIGLMLI
ncbi:feruloyl-CoA synthase, partial [Pelomonas sp. HMWF004]